MVLTQFRNARVSKVTMLHQKSSPPYPLVHSGPVLVCGNAACLYLDVAKASALFPHAPAIAVNGAAA